MSRARVLVGVVLILILATAGWWLFGWETIDNPPLGVETHRRMFGRVTVLSLDSDRDGNDDAQVFYSWRSPLGPQGAGWRDMREDRNRDGRWDTWLVNRGDRTQFRVDLNGDEVPDWEFITGDSISAFEEIRQTRGY